MIDEEEFGTATAYIEAFEALEKEGLLPQSHKALMQAHFQALDHTSSWEQLAEDVGYSGGRAVNLQYGTLAGRVARRLGVTSRPRGFWLFVLADWAQEKDARGHTAFVLRRPVIEALRRLGIVRDEPRHALNSGDPRSPSQCVCCEHNTPKQGPRICPLCGHQFRGDGWDGIDAHWRSRHHVLMTYEQFWHSLCGAHKGRVVRGDSSAMDSVVGKLRKDLERRGEYVVRANISSGWFAVFPRTWTTRTDAAHRDGREGPNLIVYRTNSGNSRDHYVIPWGIVRDFLVDDTVTHSEVNGSRRWNLTLKNGRLHVTHGSTKEVSEYYGVPLLTEDKGTPAARQAPLEFDDNFSVLEGTAREATVLARSRSRKLRDLALKRSNGICEACDTDFSVLLGGKGVHVLQVHHRRQLALQEIPKPTSPDDLAVVCANCHAIIHADPLNAVPVDSLRDQWCRERTGRSALGLKRLPGDTA